METPVVDLALQREVAVREWMSARHRNVTDEEAWRFCC